jgi:hypothetical protein
MRSPYGIAEKTVAERQGEREGLGWAGEKRFHKI